MFSRSLVLKGNRQSSQSEQYSGDPAQVLAFTGEGPGGEGPGGEGPGVGDEAQDCTELLESPPEQLDQTLFEQNGG